MRKKKKVDRKITPDPVYENVLIAKFTNHIMVSGKKSIARKIIYDCFNLIKEKTKKDPVEVFQEAIDNASPRVEVVSRRIGGARYQIPKEVSGERKTTLSMRWLIGSARKSHGKSMSEKLFVELTAAAKHEGEAIKKKREIEKIAEANRAFAHFAWR
jgi:small subunit ribosomal protein S7